MTLGGACDGALTNARALHKILHAPLNLRHKDVRGCCPFIISSSAPIVGARSLRSPRNREFIATKRTRVSLLGASWSRRVLLIVDQRVTYFMQSLNDLPRQLTDKDLPV